MNGLKKYAKWFLTPNHRYYIFTLLSIGLIFLFPLVGWNPILIFWIINACLAYREQKLSKIRFVHIAIAFILIILVMLNIIMRVLGISLELF